MLLTLSAVALAQEEPPAPVAYNPRVPGIMIALSGGGGAAMVTGPQFDETWKVGGTIDVIGAWLATPQLAIGGQFSTWETSVLGVPVHLHTIGPRLEWTPLPPDGAYFGLGAGLALTQGDVVDRAGGGGVGFAGLRLPLSTWVAVGTEVGLHGHAYADGMALLPYAALRLNLFGRHL